MRPSVEAQLLAATVAIEHVLWAAGEGLTPREVLAAVGIDWPGWREPDWHDCIHGLAIAWRRLGARGAVVPLRHGLRAAA